LEVAIAVRDPGLRVRRNYPYAGKGDGLTRILRRRFPPTRYAGIELELNQAFALGDGKPWRTLRTTVVATLQQAIEHGRRPDRLSVRDSLEIVFEREL
jgi:hypothetical protein